MSDKPAFPNITPDMPVDGYPGMTMRQYYKAMAMQGLLAGGGWMERHIAKDVPELACDLADAMLQEDEFHEAGGNDGD